MTTQIAAFTIKEMAFDGFDDGQIAHDNFVVNVMLCLARAIQMAQCPSATAISSRSTILNLTPARLAFNFCSEDCQTVVNLKP